MKNLKTIGGVLVIVGGLLATVGILLPNFIDENKKQKNNHVEVKDPCKENVFEDKAIIVASKESQNEENYNYKLATDAIEFETYMDGFSYELEEIYLDHTTYDYLIYYVNNKKLCSRRDYITNIDAHNNVVRIDLTKNEFDTSECDYYTTYAHVLEVKKGTLEKTVLVNATIKEDPQKGCYK